MRTFLILFLIFFTLSSCNKDTIYIEHDCSDPEGLYGCWFRKFPNLVGYLSGTIEMGETHIVVNFNKEGSFSYKTIILGLYENSTIVDTSAWTVDIGVYEIDQNSIDIQIENSLWWDSYYKDMDKPEVFEIDSFIEKYRNANYEVKNDTLYFTYEYYDHGYHETTERFFIR